MSYSFRVQAPTKALAEERVLAQLAYAVANQAMHSADTKHAFTAVKAYLSLLEDDPPRAGVPQILETEDSPGVAQLPPYPGRDLIVTVNGSVSSVDDGVTIQAASVSIGVGYSSHV